LLDGYNVEIWDHFSLQRAVLIKAMIYIWGKNDNQSTGKAVPSGNAKPSSRTTPVRSAPSLGDP
jgi:hypothetical protein